MEISRTVQNHYLKTDFAFLDSGILNLIPAASFVAYLVLRRHVWRSADTGNTVQRTAYSQGMLVSSVSHKYLAQQCGVGESSTYRHIQDLVEHGVLHKLNPRTLDPTSGGPTAFVLGEWLETLHGPVEYLYADVLFTKAFRQLSQLVKDHGLQQIAQLDLQIRLDVLARIFVPRTQVVDDNA